MKARGLMMKKKMKATGLLMRGYFYMWLIIKQNLYELTIYPTIISNTKVFDYRKRA